MNLPHRSEVNDSSPGSILGSVKVGWSDGFRSTIEGQLVAVLSPWKYSSDFNAKKIKSVAQSVPEISSVE